MLGVQVVSEPQVMVQKPLLHTWPAPQVLPQLPQSVLSVAVLAQYGAPLDGEHLLSAPQESVQTPLLQT